MVSQRLRGLNQPSTLSGSAQFLVAPDLHSSQLLPHVLPSHTAYSSRVLVSTMVPWYCMTRYFLLETLRYNRTCLWSWKRVAVLGRGGCFARFAGSRLPFSSLPTISELLEASRPRPAVQLHSLRCQRALGDRGRCVFRLSWRVPAALGVYATRSRKKCAASRPMLSCGSQTAHTNRRGLLMSCHRAVQRASVASRAKA